MVTKDSAFLKTQRLKEIAQKIALRLTKNSKVDYNAFLSVVEYEYGLSRAKAKKYIKLICETHSWEIEVVNRKPFIKVIPK